MNDNCQSKEHNGKSTCFFQLITIITACNHENVINNIIISRNIICTVDIYYYELSENRSSLGDFELYCNIVMTRGGGLQDKIDAKGRVLIGLGPES